MLCYAMLCYAMLCYAMLCYAMLCYAMLCYAMPCSIAPYCYLLSVAFRTVRSILHCSNKSYFSHLTSLKFFPILYYLIMLVSQIHIHSLVLILFLAISFINIFRARELKEIAFRSRGVTLTETVKL